MKKIFPLLLVIGLIFQVLIANITAGNGSGDIYKLEPEWGKTIKVSLKKEQVVSWHWMVIEPSQPSIPKVTFEIRLEDGTYFGKRCRIGGEPYVYDNEHSGSYSASEDGVYRFVWSNGNDFTVFVHLSEFEAENTDGLDAPNMVSFLLIICIATIIGYYRKRR